VRIQREAGLANSDNVSNFNREIETLRQRLDRHTQRMVDSDLTEQHSVFIKDLKFLTAGRQDTWSNISDIQQSNQFESDVSDQSDESAQFEKGKYYNIRSMKVLWNGVSSTMHVFIDTTNILKLEEANNSVKWCKFMFTSVCHKFRNPLNAIVNAWNIVHQSFKNVMGILNGQALEFEMQEQLEIYSETVNKFIKIGKYSSTLLLSLVEDVLNLSKIESNIFTINMAKLNAKELFEMFEFQSERKTSN
jgi:hypothetical protein